MGAKVGKGEKGTENGRLVGSLVGFLKHTVEGSMGAVVNTMMNDEYTAPGINVDMGVDIRHLTEYIFNSRKTNSCYVRY